MLSAFRHHRGGRLGWLLAFATLLVGAAADLDSVDPVARSLQVLREPGLSAEARQQALEELRTLGQQTGAAVQGLLQVVADPAAPLELRLRAVALLPALGLADEESARRLFTVLGDPEANVELRRTILLVFGERRETAPLLVPVLTQVALDPANALSLRRQAIVSLSEHLAADGVQPALVTLLGRSGDADSLRWDALDALRRPHQISSELLNALVALAGSRTDSPALRSGAMDVLGSFGTQAAAAAPALAELALEPETPNPLRERALDAAGRMAAAADLARLLAPALFQPALPPEFRGTLADWLGSADTTLVAEPAAWIALLGDDGQPGPVRRLAARELAPVDPPPPELPTLWARILDDRSQDEELRMITARALRRGGQPGEALADLLGGIVQDSTQPMPLREFAGDWLAALATDRLRRPDQLSREELAHELEAVRTIQALLEQAGLSTAPARQGLDRVRRIREVLLAEQESRWWDRGWEWAQAHPAWAWILGSLLVLVLLGAAIAAAWSLTIRWAPADAWDPAGLLARLDAGLPRRLGGGKAAARRTEARARGLVEHALSLDRPERSSAIEQLGALGRQAESILPTLRATCRDPEQDLDIRYAALTVLGLLGPVSAAAGTDLRGIALDRREQVYVRMKALDALGQIGVEAGEQRALAEQLSDPAEPEVMRRKAAAWLEAPAKPVASG